MHTIGLGAGLSTPGWRTDWSMPNKQALLLFSKLTARTTPSKGRVTPCNAAHDYAKAISAFERSSGIQREARPSIRHYTRRLSENARFFRSICPGDAESGRN